jgi:hypothetical protein
MHHLKYDSMIIACAIRHAAAMVVSLDPGMAKLATAAKFPAKQPKDFADPQPRLFP